MMNASKKSKSKSKAPAKRLKGPKKLATKKNRRAMQAAKKKSGKTETKEEREKRRAKLEALTLRAFRMAYDNYHNL